MPCINSQSTNIAYFSSVPITVWYKNSNKLINKTKVSCIVSFYVSADIHVSLQWLPRYICEHKNSILTDAGLHIRHQSVLGDTVSASGVSAGFRAFPAVFAARYNSARHIV